MFKPFDEQFEQWFIQSGWRAWCNGRREAGFPLSIAQGAWEAAQQAAPAQPVAWAQLGLRNGHTYVRMNYEGHLYPPPADVQRNLNLVPLYAAAQPMRQPLTDAQIDAGIDAWFAQAITTNDGKDRGHPFCQRMRAALDRARGLGPNANLTGAAEAGPRAGRRQRPVEIGVRPRCGRSKESDDGALCLRHATRVV